MGVTFCAVAAEHPLALHAAKTNPALAAFHRRMPSRQRHRGRHGHDGKEGDGHGTLRHAPADRREGRGLGRQLRADGLRRRRGDGRARPRRARLRIREEVRAADQAGHRRARTKRFRRMRMRPWYADKERGRCVFSGKYDDLDVRGGSRRGRRGSRRQGPGREEDHVPPARLERFAPALLGHADPDHSLRRVRRGPGAGARPAGGAARGLRAGRQRQPAQQARGLS